MPASNATFVGEVDGVRVVYKPVAGERPLWDFPDGTLADREVAAYLVSVATGWDVVPHTFCARDRTVPAWSRSGRSPTPSSRRSTSSRGPVPRRLAARLRRRSTPATSRSPWSTRTPSALRRMALFDILVNNADRKGGHVLAMTGGHRYGVDHGVTFHAEASSAPCCGAGPGEPLPRGPGRREPVRDALTATWAARWGSWSRRRAGAAGPPLQPAAVHPADARAPRRVAHDPVATLLGRLHRMRAWSAPEVPVLPVVGPPVQLHDTATGRPGHLQPGRRRHGSTSAASRRTTPPTWATPRRTSPSTCSTGPGAAPGTRSPTCRTSPTSTTRCSSAPTKVELDWVELAERETELFRQDMTALRVLPPDHLVGAVESIPLVVA